MTRHDTLVQIHYTAVDIKKSEDLDLIHGLAQEIIDLIVIVEPPLTYPPKETKG